MNMLMIICPQNREENIRGVIEKHGVHFYSEIGNVTGTGKTGKRMGNRLWPGTSTLMFTTVEDDKKNELISALKSCSADLYPGEGLKAFILPAEEAF